MSYPLDGEHEECIRIDANGEYASFPNPGGILTAAAVTHEMWLRPQGWSLVNGQPDDAGSHNIILHAQNAAGWQYINIRILAGGVYFLYRQNGVWDGGFLGAVLPLFDIPDGTWHHVAFVCDGAGIDGSANTRRIYLDDVLVGTSNGLVLPPIWTGLQTIELGNDAIFGAVTPFDGDIDNLKVFNYAKTDFSDRLIEGFTPPVTETPPFPVFIEPKRPRVMVMGQDLVCRIAETPKIVEKRSVGSDLVFPSDCRLVCENFDGAFSLENPRSIFAGALWQNQPVEIWDNEGIKIWSGVLSETQVDHAAKTATLVSRSNLYEWRDTPVDYASGGAEAPGTALLNIAAAIGFPHLDSGYLQRSIAQQTADGIAIDVTLADSDNETFGNVLNKLADYGTADCYEHLGKLRYVYYDGSAPRPGVTLSECDYVSTPKPVRNTKALINDYAIGRAGPVTETDSGNGNIGAISRQHNGTFHNDKIPGDVDAKYTVPNAAAAVALGESYIRRTHVDLATHPRPRIEVKFDLEVHHRVWVDLASDFRMDFAREAWVGKIFRVVAFTRDDRARRIALTALEWPE